MRLANVNQAIWYVRIEKIGLGCRYHGEWQVSRTPGHLADKYEIVSWRLPCLRSAGDQLHVLR